MATPHTLLHGQNQDKSTSVSGMVGHLRAAQQRVEDWMQRYHDEGLEGSLLITKIFEELRTTLEELRVVDEELETQNEILIQTRSELEHQRQRYHDLFEFAPDGYLVTTLYGVILEANHAMLALLNIRREFLLNRPVAVFVTSKYRAAFRLYLAQIPDIPEIHDWEVRVQPYKGLTPIDVSMSVAILHDLDRKPVELLWLFRDVTKRNEVMEALRKSEEENRCHNQELVRLSRRLLEVQEVEKRAIARELHDEIGQSLTALKIMLGMQVEKAPTSLQPALEILDGLINQVRSLSLDLRPSILDDLGLIPALLWYFKRYTTQTSIRVRFKHQGIKHRLPHDLETAVFRIVQEALTNAARYAGVKTISVRILLADETLSLEIVDKGQGFDSEKVLTSNQSAGLSGMIERAALLDGQLQIKSAPGKGCQIQASVPLKTEALDGQHRTG